MTAQLANDPWTTTNRAMYIGRPICTATITAQDQWTVPSYFSTEDSETAGVGTIDISVAGTFTATVTLQRSFDDGVTWRDVASYTTATESSVANPNQSVKWRLGVKTGNFTSSSTGISVRLSQC